MISSFKNDNVYIIESEYSLLNDNLKKELIKIEDKAFVKLSPFSSHISAPTDMVMMDEYHWILTEEVLKQFKMSQSDQFVLSPEWK